MSVKSFTEQLVKMQQAFDAIKPPEQKIQIVINVAGGGDRRESILRNQNGGEIDALKRKLGLK